jgi:tRNA threonylcarbamoyladenosine biosynthesis protein TsaE
VELLSRSAAETRRLGEHLGRLVQPGDFVALYGDLGAGKTQFVQGVARGLAVPEEYRVTSPTYTLMNMYPGRLPLYHFDLYRLTSADELADLGFDEYFFGSGVCLVEWSERLGTEGPDDLLLVTLRYVAEEQRAISFKAQGERSRKLLAALAGGEKTFDPLHKSC